jgi:REP element-mobilizing transposase RayT
MNIRGETHAVRLYSATRKPRREKKLRIFAVRRTPCVSTQRATQNSQLQTRKNSINMEKFQNKYRIPSARAKWWDYGQEGVYFITICTANRKCLFGNIVDSSMTLSPAGEIVNQEWGKSFEIRKELSCDAFVIMPNHIHAILRIDNVGVDSGAGTRGSTAAHGIARRSSKSVSSFVAGFKSATTKSVNDLQKTSKFVVWQARFHDHIIRNDAEYRRISDYIISNPYRWADDKFYVETHGVRLTAHRENSPHG